MGRFDRILLASDFDNTLVHTQAALSAGLEDIPPMCERNLRALESFTKNGGLFSISTGRAVPAFAHYAASLPINAPCVVANGAGLYDFQSGEYIETAFLQEDCRPHIEQLLTRFPDLSFEIYHTDRRIHAMHPNSFILTHEHLTRTPMEVIEDFSVVDFPLVKFLFEAERERLDELLAYLRAQPWAARYELIYSSNNMLEMTAHGATKGGMVRKLAAHLGIRPENLYCIGDHGNDVSMALVSAIRFCPANAIDEMKALPDMRIVSHCADGAVADVIECLEQRYGASATNIS